jgi:cyanophycinase
LVRVCESFCYLDATNIDVLYIDKREEAADEAVLTRLKAADIVIFTGGSTAFNFNLGGTAFQDILLDKYQNEEFVYAGTSAGAAAATSNIDISRKQFRSC